MSWRQPRARATLARVRRPATGRLNSGVSRLMNRLAIFLVFFAPAWAAAGESPVVDTRLAHIIESAAITAGFDINVSQSTHESVNINTVNGKDVCDPAAIDNVRKFQDAVAQQPHVKNNFGPAYYSTTAPDGMSKILSLEQLIKQGTLEGCTSIYISVIAQ